MADDPVQPRPERPVGVVLLPAPERLGERVLGHVHRAVGVAQDRVRHAIDIVGMVPVRPVDRVGAKLVGHTLSTRDGPDPLHVGRAAPRRTRTDQASSLLFMQSKVWPIILLAVPSIRRAPTLASVPAMLTSAFQSMTVVAIRSVREAHLGGRVDGAAGRLAVGLDQRPVRLLELGELHVGVEAGADEPDPDLRDRLEVGRIHDLDLLHARPALTHLLGVDDERPDLLARAH